MAAKKANTSLKKTRNYTTLIYDESAAENWREIIASWQVSCFVGPLHCKDINPTTGEVKKAHRHVVLMFDGPKTIDQARELFDQLGAVGCEAVNSLRGAARYLCHLDNPEKAQYSPEEVLAFAGADYFGTISLPTDKYGAIAEMLSFCEENDILRYYDLLRYAMENRSDWFRVLCDNGSYVVIQALKSRSWVPPVPVVPESQKTDKED